MPQAVGFFTDTSVCIGCKACEVACKEWNQLKGNPPEFRGDSFDNTGKLDAQNWRHVAFFDKVPEGPVATGNGQAWLMFSDVCKHCTHAACMEVCPTGAIIRTEFDTVFIQQDVCNGCRDCIAACPFGVIGFSEETGTVHKCTFCYDRLQNGLTPACAKVCPTQAIQFGALKAFFLLMDKPEVYGLPNEQNAVLPRRNNRPGYLGAFATAVLGVLAGLVAFRERGEVRRAEEALRTGRTDKA